MNNYWRLPDIDAGYVTRILENSRDINVYLGGPLKVVPFDFIFDFIYVLAFVKNSIEDILEHKLRIKQIISQGNKSTILVNYCIP